MSTASITHIFTLGEDFLSSRVPKMWVIILLVILVIATIACSTTEGLHPTTWGGDCPDHCNCAVFTQEGKWVKCQKARMNDACAPKHRDKACRDAAHGMTGVDQFKMGCWGSSCGHPDVEIGHSLQCTKEHGRWIGHLHSSQYAGEDLRCHK